MVEAPTAVEAEGPGQRALSTVWDASEQVPKLRPDLFSRHRLIGLGRTQGQAPPGWRLGLIPRRLELGLLLAIDDDLRPNS